MSTNAPVSGKVWGSTVGGGVGTAFTTFILWVMGVYLWGTPNTADSAIDAIAAVPFPVVGIVTAIFAFGGLFIGGYMAKHTPRAAEAGTTNVTVIASKPEEFTGNAQSDDLAEDRPTEPIAEPVESFDQQSSRISGVNYEEERELPVNADPHYGIPEYPTPRTVAEFEAAQEKKD